ncbi:MAG: hypothetical protein ACRDPY_43080 [Streptosporangiaceae bacterium]
MINISNFISEDNPSWPQHGTTERLTSVRPSTAARAAGRSPGAWTRDTGARVRDTWTWIRNGLTVVACMLAAWVSSMPRRWLDRLFEKNDAEAYWRGWQISKVRGGLGRRYRDPHFDTLAACSRCVGMGSREGQPCSPCVGTGRVMIEAGSLTGGVS